MMDIFESLESEVRCYCRNLDTVFERTASSMIYSEDGREYVGFFSGASALSYGHNHPALLRPLVEYVLSGAAVHSLDMKTAAKHRFLETFQQLILRPRNLDYEVMFPGPAGTNCVEAALKLARKVTGRPHVLGFQAGCGRTWTFFSFEDSGITMDIVCLAKSISGFGLPLALTLFNRELGVWKPGEHNGTFRGHDLSFVTGAAASEHFWRDTAFEAQIAARLEQLHPGVAGIADATEGATVRGGGLAPPAKALAAKAQAVGARPDMVQADSTKALSTGTDGTRMLLDAVASVHPRHRAAAGERSDSLASSRVWHPRAKMRTGGHMHTPTGTAGPCHGDGRDRPMEAPSSIAGTRPFLSTATAQQEPVPTVVTQMHEVTTGSSMPPTAQPDPAANVRAGVTVYFLGGEQNLLYVEVNGQWVEYVKSAPPSEDQKPVAQAPLTQPIPHTDTSHNARPGPDAWPGPVHWAGYTCHSPDELTRNRKRRVYYDPATKPVLSFTGNGEAPTLPLPVLELTDDHEDPTPWLDPDTGERFSSDGASMVLRLLRYAPRKAVYGSRH